MFPNSILPTSGIGLYHAVKYLRLRGHEFHVIYALNRLPFPLNLFANQNDVEQQKYPKHEEFEGIPIDFLPYKFIYRFLKPEVWGRTLWSQIGKKMTRITEEYRPDLIWSQTAIPNSCAALELSKKMGIPYIVMIHGSDLNSVVHLPGAQEEIRKVYENAVGVIALSERLKREALEAAPASTIKIAHFGADMGELESAFEERERWLNTERSPDKCTVLSVSRAVKTKGIQYNIDVMNRLKDKYPGLIYRNIGEGEIRQKLIKKVNDLDLKGRAILTGRLQYEESKLVMARSDIYSMPSYKEGLGLTYLESMALGIPTIGVRGQGGEDLIEDGVNGFLADPHDVDELTTIWEKLINEPDLRMRIGEAGRKTILERLTWKICSEKMDQVFQQLVSGSRDIG